MGYPHRIKPEGEAWYHLYVSTVARGGEYPLEEAYVQHKLIETITFYSRCYMVRLAAFCSMGNHLHILIRKDAKRKLKADELMAQARLMYPRSQKKLDAWGEAKWERFEERIFDVSEYMRSILGYFATWYNRTHNRKGRFWAERFKSTLLLSGESVRDCAMYIELNPVRAGICERPEEYRWSSLYLREAKKDAQLLPLSQLLGERRKRLYEMYKEMLYHRGAVNTKPGQRSISQETLKREASRGFKRRGVYRKKLRHFTDGLALGGEAAIREQLAKFRASGRYQRRQHPIPQETGVLWSLREQRGTFIPLT